MLQQRKKSNNLTIKSIYKMGLLREIGVTNEIKKIFKKLDLKIRGTFTKLKTCPTEIVFLEKIREHLRVRV